MLAAAVRARPVGVAGGEAGRLTSLIESLRSGDSAGRAPERALARRLVAYAGGDDARREWLTDRLRHAACYLARDRTPPRRGPRAVAWRAVIIAAGWLHESGVRRLPTRAFLNRAELDALVREGRRQRPKNRARRTQYAPPGPALRRLAVDRRLTRAASRALGCHLEPAFVAVYLYDMPRSHGRPHLDNAPYEIIVHLVLEHRGATNRRGGSALVVHRPRRDVRLTVAPGQAVVLSGRGAVHQWERLGAREQRTLIAIGLRSC